MSGSTSGESLCSCSGMWKKARALGLRSVTSGALDACLASRAGAPLRSPRFQMPSRSSAPSGTNGRSTGLIEADVLRYQSVCDSCRPGQRAQAQQRSQRLIEDVSEEMGGAHVDVVVLELGKRVPGRDRHVVTAVEEVDARQVDLGATGRRGEQGRARSEFAGKDQRIETEKHARIAGEDLEQVVADAVDRLRAGLRKRVRHA